MLGDGPAAGSAGPLDHFLAHELLSADRSETLCIFNQAELIALAVAFIHALDQHTREIFTIHAQRKPALAGACLDLAVAAVIRFAPVRAAAALTGFFLSQMYIAHRAVYPAGGKYEGWNFLRHFYGSTSQ